MFVCVHLLGVFEFVRSCLRKEDAMNGVATLPRTLQLPNVPLIDIVRGQVAQMYSLLKPMCKFKAV